MLIDTKLSDDAEMGGFVSRENLWRDHIAIYRSLALEACRLRLPPILMRQCVRRSAASR